MYKRHDNDFTILLLIEKSKGNNTNIALIYFYHGSSALSICHFKFSALNHFKHFFSAMGWCRPKWQSKDTKSIQKNQVWAA